MKMNFIRKIFLATMISFLLVNTLKAQKRNKIITHCVVTIYHPVKSQTDGNPLITADGSKIDLKKLKRKEIRWCAISKDLLWMFPKNKPKRIYIEGMGVYEVRDTMNERFDHRVDILQHPSDKRMLKKRLKIIIL